MNLKYKISLSICLIVGIGFQLFGQSASYGKLFVHENGIFQVKEAHEFRQQTNDYPAGIIATERAGNKGLVHFGAASSWAGASINAFVDGYVGYTGNTAFTFPIGDNTNFQPMAISAGLNTTAAYFQSSPSIATTSDFNGGTTPVLPVQGPFPITQIDATLSVISAKEYWDISGTFSAVLTFTYDASSEIGSLTNNDLSQLTLAGWNGTNWILIPSTVDNFALDITQSNGTFSTSASTLIVGAISTNEAIMPDQYELFTFAAKESIAGCTDADGDGVCASEDCDDNNPNVPASPNTLCDDGDELTENDVIQADGCTCLGEPIAGCTDADGDGVCVLADCDDNNPNVPTAPNTLCDDGDELTENDVIQADGCTCLGEPIAGCTDADGDGVCALEDCDDNNPNVPIAPNTLCDDGDELTENDVIQADGCACEGEPVEVVAANCSNVEFIGGNQQILLTNLTSDFEVVEIIGANTGYQTIEICRNNCAIQQVIPNLTPGDYQVKLNMQTTDGSYCYRQETVTVTEGLCEDVDADGVCAALDCDDTDPTFPKAPNTSCNDGNELTENDVIQADGCTCLGMEPCVDADGDDVCALDDCDDTDPTFPKAPNTPCDDEDELTENDVIQSDGCTCQGTLPGAVANCSGVQFIGDNQQIILTNLTAQGEIVEIIGANTGWQIVEVCRDNCSIQQVISNLAPGDYQVKLNMFGDDGSYCYREETVTVTEGPCEDADGDNVCAALDCDDTNPNFPMPPNTPCDDENELTQNDVIQSDGCTCTGVAPCVDADGDTVCALDDCDDNDPNFPMTPNTPCNDGNELTQNDVILSDGCTCAGSLPGGAANCGDVEFIGEEGQIRLTNLNAQNEIIEIIGANTGWLIVPICNFNCPNPGIIPNLSAGEYNVKLQMIGDDGSYCYREETVNVLPSSSSRTSALNHLSNPNLVHLYPNPAREEVNLQLDKALEDYESILLYNYMGNEILELTAEENNKARAIKIDLSLFTNGIYQVVIKHNSRPVIVKKMVITRMY